MPELSDLPNERSPEPLVASHQALDARIVSLYFIVGLALAVLAAGAAYRQLVQNGAFGESERLQQERRVLYPGPRGRIFDRDGRLLVGNASRFSVVLYLDELQPEFQREAARVRVNFRKSGEGDITWGDVMEIAQVAVVRRYFERINRLLGRSGTLDVSQLKRHLRERLLLPYTLMSDLSAREFARLLEQLPVKSPLQIYVDSVRTYPYGSAASHVLGYVGREDNVGAEGFPGSDLMTFKMEGTVGRDGLEKEFDRELQGEAGGAIYRVSPAGFRVNPPVFQLAPKPGHDLVTSLDIDLQQVAERAIGDRAGAAVALDVRTGEVLVFASKPDYDLNRFPRDPAAVAEATRTSAWNDYADSGAGRFAPGSTFKIVVSIAGLLSGRLDPTDTSVDCEGRVRIGNRWFSCDNGEGHHGRLDLAEAIAQSCDIYFYEHGLRIGPQLITDEARRFRLDQPTGIELPGEDHGLIPDPAAQLKETGTAWTPGETANISIGQGAIAVTPLEMACFVASVARGQVWTRPTLLHDPNRPEQHTPSIGLTPEQRAVLLEGMEGVTTDGTASILTTVPLERIPGVRIAGKTGTAQHGHGLDVAWFICFAPIEHPEIAVAVALQGDTPGETYGGGREAAPVADAILRAYFAKRRAATATGSPASAQTSGSPSAGSI
ncbi:MAG: peptidoglycan D,D-transpeptidase FtsI family protein [Opitutaceae bacterium]